MGAFSAILKTFTVQCYAMLDKDEDKIKEQARNGMSKEDKEVFSKCYKIFHII